MSKEETEYISKAFKYALDNLEKGLTVNCLYNSETGNAAIHFYNFKYDTAISYMFYYAEFLPIEMVYANIKAKQKELLEYTSKICAPLW